MPRHLDVRRGIYLDSVSLMQVSRDVAALDGVGSALIAMATELNLELLATLGFPLPSEAAPTDLVIAVDAHDDESLATALAAIETLLDTRTASAAAEPGGFGSAPAPRTVAAAVRRSDPALVLVSTPGQYAYLDAMDAIDQGTSVMVFSDNVALDQEISLKEAASARGLLVMGPDCGTAVVSGVGLGFANVVRPGPVGIVAASGTGAQQLMCLLDASGIGISHCLGVGSHDLSSAVAGRSTLTALDLLAADAATEVIVLIGKPPAPDVAAAVRQRADELGKPLVFGLQGAGEPDLTAIARSVVDAAGGTWHEPRSWPAHAKPVGPYRHIRGIFSGGTLCTEAMLIASPALGPIHSNVPLQPDWALGADLHARGHTMIDFGDDRLTQGRPHPMIDQSLRAERITAEAHDPDAGVLLIDVVLGYGAHPDPAGELSHAITQARASAAADDRDLAVVISLVGSTGDPQGLERQAQLLRDAGASVHLSNAAATREAVALVEGPS
jgi:FdrA protein